MTRLQRLQRISFGAGIAGGALALLTANGCPVVRTGDPGWAWLLHPLLFALGAGAGVATMLRGVEIDRRRWQIVDDPQLTKGEREYAHKEAERQRRIAGTLLFLGPVFLGYWLAYQVRGDSLRLLTDLLIITPLLGYLAGLLLGRRYDR